MPSYQMHNKAGELIQAIRAMSDVNRTQSINTTEEFSVDCSIQPKNTIDELCNIGGVKMQVSVGFSGASSADENFDKKSLKKHYICEQLIAFFESSNLVSGIKSACKAWLREQAQIDVVSADENISDVIIHKPSSSDENRVRLKFYLSYEKVSISNYNYQAEVAEISPDLLTGDEAQSDEHDDNSASLQWYFEIEFKYNIRAKGTKIELRVIDCKLTTENKRIVEIIKSLPDSSEFSSGNAVSGAMRELHTQPPLAIRRSQGTHVSPAETPVGTCCQIL